MDWFSEGVEKAVSVPEGVVWGTIIRFHESLSSYLSLDIIVQRGNVNTRWL